VVPLTSVINLKTMGAVTTDEFKAAMASFAAGVTVVTTVDEAGVPFGLTATAFSSVSKDPPMCLVCVAHAAEAYPVIRQVGRFAVNILGRGQAEESERFSAHGIDKFAGVRWAPGAHSGCPLLAAAIASIECVVSTTVPAGDHDVFLGAIQEIRLLGNAEPLVYFRGRYRDLVDP
jgi:flavin reductase (DIM6/NTAB) family NADH-FMN oxidoreductase RutF